MTTPRTKTEPAEPAGPAYPRVTPRLTVAMDKEIQADLSALALIELGHGNVSAYLRHLAVMTIRQAREDGLLPKQRRRAS